MPRLLLAVLLACSLPGCFISSSAVDLPLDPQAIAELKPGQTTAQQVADLLGAPARVVELGERSAWLYEHVSEKQAGLFLLVVILRGVDSQSDRIWVFFDQNQILTHVGSTFQAATAEHALPGFGFGHD